MKIKKKVNGFIYNILDKKGKYEIDKNFVGAIVTIVGLYMAWIGKPQFQGVLYSGLIALGVNKLISMDE